jgi:replication-associated recombination protein RarA
VYLPEALRGHRYYTPSDSGDERAIAERLARWRDES